MVSRQRLEQKARPEKHRAREILFRAVKRGLVLKPAICEYCRLGGRIEAHHDDYTKPLDVRWLCSSCHALIHPHGAQKRSVCKYGHSRIPGSGACKTCERIHSRADYLKRRNPKLLTPLRTLVVT